MAAPASETGPNHEGLDSSEKEEQIKNNNIAHGLFDKGDYKGAAVRFRTTLAWCEQSLGPKDSITLDVRESLADCLLELGSHEQLAEAATLEKRTLQGRSEEQGDEHVETLEIQHKLALTFYNLGEFGKAKNLDRKTFAARQKILGRTNEDTLSSRHNLAASLQALGRHEEAEQMNRATLQMRELKCDKDNEDLIASRHNLAKNLHSLRRFNEAENLVQANIDVLEKNRSPNDPQLTASLNFRLLNKKAALLQGPQPSRVESQKHERKLTTSEKVEKTGRNVLSTLDEANVNGRMGKSNLAIRIEDFDGHQSIRPNRYADGEPPSAPCKVPLFKGERNTNLRSRRRRSFTEDDRNIVAARGGSQGEKPTLKDANIIPLRRSRSTPNPRESSRETKQEGREAVQQKAASSIRDVGEAKQKSIGTPSSGGSTASIARKSSSDAIPKEPDAKANKNEVDERHEETTRPSEKPRELWPSQIDTDNLYKNLFDAHRGSEEPAR